jgi:hypothetical protein
VIVSSVGMLAGTVGVAGASKSTDIAQAKKGLLKLSDLPKGWTSSSSGNNSNGAFPGEKQLAACLGVPASVVNSNYPTANSRDFNSGNQSLTVSDSVTVDPSHKLAITDFNALASSKAPTCMTAEANGAERSEFAGIAPKGGTVGTIEFTRSPASGFAPHVANLTMRVPLTDEGESISIEIIMTDFVKGDEEQLMSLTSYDATFPTSLSRHLTEVADSRI